MSASSAFAVQEELLAEARKLVSEAKPFVERANDVELDMTARKQPRMEAFRRLKEARTFYDRYLDANPTLEEALDREYVEMMVILHGIKKDSALGDLEPESEHTQPAAEHTPKPPERLAAVRAYEKAHPGDLPQVQKMYTAFLADFPDPSLPEYVEAVRRLGEVNERIKSVFRNATKRDFDSLSGKESKDELKLVATLTAELTSRDAEARRRAARLLATTRSRAASYPLARSLMDADKELAAICRDGLLAIGGTSVGISLDQLYRHAPRAKQRAALDLLKALLAKGETEAANQSRAIGGFTLPTEGPTAEEAFELLVTMGRIGGPGLTVTILNSEDVEKRARAMSLMADIKYHQGAALLAQRFLVPTQGDSAAAQLYGAAAAAIEKMGASAVPYLLDALRGQHGHLVARVVTRITGFTVTPADEEKVREWWEAHKPKGGD